MTIDGLADRKTSGEKFKQGWLNDITTEQWATAKRQLNRVDNQFEDTNVPHPDRYGSLRSRCNTLKGSIKDSQMTHQLDHVTNCLDACEGAVLDGNLDQKTFLVHKPRG